MVNRLGDSAISKCCKCNFSLVEKLTNSLHQIIDEYEPIFVPLSYFIHYSLPPNPLGLSSSPLRSFFLLSLHSTQLIYPFIPSFLFSHSSHFSLLHSCIKYPYSKY